MKNPPMILGSHVEPFVDDALIGGMDDLSLKLHEPVKKEIVFTFDQPWEKGPSYCTLIRDEDGRIRLYYRAASASGNFSDQQTTGLAFSDDGIHFERPRLGLIEYEGCTDNNLVWKGIEGHNLTPFLDENPAADPACRYKATGGPMWKLYGLCSPDGIHWRKLQDEPLDHEGVFDSQNVTFWDANTGCYRSFSRYFDGGWPKGIRAIQSAVAEDYIHWSKPRPHSYTPDLPLEHFYTNATIRYPGHPNLLLSFPNRYVFERKIVEDHSHKGVCDTVFISSRDGVNWDRRFAAAWMRPGTDPLNWTERSNRIALGMVQLAADEWGLYCGEHHRRPDERLRRYTLRPHGFGSVHAGFGEGVLTTRPLTFEGNRLHLNFSTSAVGFVQVEVLAPDGKPLPGFTRAMMDPVYGDRLDHVVVWKDGPDLSPLAGQTVCLRFFMREADLYALQLK